MIIPLSAVSNDLTLLDSFGLSPPRSPDRPAAILFARELINDRGKRRIVIVVCHDSALQPFVLIPGSLISPCAFSTAKNRYNEIDLSPELVMQLYAGSIQPTDRSRFIILGKYNGREFTIQGHLDANEHVYLSTDLPQFTEN